MRQAVSPALVLLTLLLPVGVLVGASSHEEALRCRIDAQDARIRALEAFVADERKAQERMRDGGRGVLRRNPDPYILPGIEPMMLAPLAAGDPWPATGALGPATHGLPPDEDNETPHVVFGACPVCGKAVQTQAYPSEATIDGHPAYFAEAICGADGSQFVIMLALPVDDANSEAGE